MVDTALMGHLDEEVYVGAIALGSMIFNFIYWGLGFLRMGTTGMTAQAFGGKDEAGSILILGRAVLVVLGSSLLIILLQVPVAYLSFRWLIDGSEAVEELAASYFYIRVWAAPASLGLLALHGWFLGMQNARYPMWLTVFVNAANIGLSYLFVIGMDLKADGAAWGTVCAQYLGLIAGVLLFLGKHKALLVYIKRKALLEVAALRSFFVINRDIFIRSLLLVFSFAFFTAKSAETNDTLLAANQILQQLLMMTSYAVDGFAFAAESLVGRYKGSQNRAALKSAVRWIFVWGMGIGVSFALIFEMWGENLLFIFTDQPAILEEAAQYLGWVILVSVISVAAFIWDGVYIGATATRSMVMAMTVSTLGVFLPTYYFCFPTLGNHGLWLAMVAFMLSRGLMLTFFAKKEGFIS